MKNETLLDLGRVANNVDKAKQRYLLDLSKENGVIIGGYSATGKTNLLNYLRKQLLEQNYKVSNFVVQNREYLLNLKDKYKENVHIETSEGQRLVFLRNHVKEIKRRKKIIDKANVTYDEYVANFMPFSNEEQEWKRTVIIIDDFSVNLMKMKLATPKKYSDYMTLLEYILSEGSKYGMKLILVGLRFINGDVPLKLLNSATCKISFMNPKSDFIENGLYEEDMKFPKKVGELVITSNTDSQITFVKSYILL